MTSTFAQKSTTTENLADRKKKKESSLKATAMQLMSSVFQQTETASANRVTSRFVRSLIVMGISCMNRHGSYPGESIRNICEEKM